MNQSRSVRYRAPRDRRVRATAAPRDDSIADASGQRIPGNIPFIPRIIFCSPPLATIFIIF